MTPGARVAATIELLDEIVSRALEGERGRPADLVANAYWPCFRTTLDALMSPFNSQGFELELTGPWPPYNFATNGRHEDNHE